MRTWLARNFLRLNGWRTEGARPEAPRFVLIAAPHTSNWDLAYLLAMAAVFDVKISFLAKHTLFRPPLGFAMRALGGIPVRRKRNGNLVDQMARAFDGRERLALVVPVEGTRSYTPHWKSGFYHIASSADVPIVMSFLDYERRVGGFGPTLHPSGDLRADMDLIRAFYADKKGRFPDDFGEVRLKEETQAARSARA